MPTSMKKLAAEGAIKKSDIYRVKLTDLYVEEGFNLREESPELEEHIESLTESIMSGAYIPPLVVRVDDESRVVLIDGHCRRRAYLRAVERGTPIEYVSAEAFKGNDADRVLTMITSSQGQALRPLEAARGFKRLRNFGWTVREIASGTGRSYNYVDALLTLTDSPADLQLAISEGLISVNLAIELHRKHGEKSGKVVRKMLEKADKTSPKTARVTPQMVSGLPTRKILAGVYERARAIRDELPSTTLWRLQAEEVSGTVEIEAATLKALLDAVGVEEEETKDGTSGEASQ